MVVIQFVGDIKSKYNPLRSKQPCTYRCNQSWLSHPVETNRYKGETQTSASAAKWKWSTVSTGISTNFRIYTSKTNMALENRYLEKEVPVGNQQFRIHVGFPGMDAYCSWCSVLNHKFQLLEHMDFEVKFYKGSTYIMPYIFGCKEHFVVWNVEILSPLLPAPSWKTNLLSECLSFGLDDDMVHSSCGNLNLNLHECHRLHPGLVDPTHNENSLNMPHLSPLKLPSKKTSKFQDGKMDGIWKPMGLL